MPQESCQPFEVARVGIHIKHIPLTVDEFVCREGLYGAAADMEYWENKNVEFYAKSGDTERMNYVISIANAQFKEPSFTEFISSYEEAEEPDEEGNIIQIPVYTYIDMEAPAYPFDNKVDDLGEVYWYPNSMRGAHFAFEKDTQGWLPATHLEDAQTIRPERATSLSPGQRPGLYIPPQKNCALKGQHLFFAKFARAPSPLPQGTQASCLRRICKTRKPSAPYPITLAALPFRLTRHITLAEQHSARKKSQTIISFFHQNNCPIKEKHNTCQRNAQASEDKPDEPEIADDTDRACKIEYESIKTVQKHTYFTSYNITKINTLMKQLKLTLAILFLLMTNALAAHDFEAKNDDGVTIYYNIISEKDKTVAVTFGPNYNTSYRNHVSIPSKVSYNGSTSFIFYTFLRFYTVQIYTFLRFSIRVLMKKLKIFDYFNNSSLKF